MTFHSRRLQTVSEKLPTAFYSQTEVFKYHRSFSIFNSACAQQVGYLFVKSAWLYKIMLIKEEIFKRWIFGNTDTDINRKVYFRTRPRANIFIRPESIFAHGNQRLRPKLFRTSYRACTKNSSFVANRISVDTLFKSTWCTLNCKSKIETLLRKTLNKTPSLYYSVPAIF